MNQSYPMLEYDNAPEAIIEPKRLFDIEMLPERAIICFYQDVIGKLLEQKKLQQIPVKRRERSIHPIGAVTTISLYELMMKDCKILIFHPGVGSAIASAMFEEVIALGCKKFIACGSAGVLNKDIAYGHIIVPIAAIRDEGISYHYLPPGREVSANSEGVTAIIDVLKSHRYNYLLTKTWTTDAIYRETVTKVQRRRAEGCQVVEMEAASLFAVAQFRKVQLAQILYGSDDISSSDWNAREHPNRMLIREKVFWLAVEACLQL